MAGLFAINSCVDIDDAVIPFRKAGNFDSRSVGNFAVQVPKELLPDDLSHYLSLRLIGGNILREQERPFFSICTANI